MKLGEFRKMLEIAPDSWDDLEIRICWGLHHPTTEMISDNQMKVRVDTKPWIMTRKPMAKKPGIAS